MTPVRQHHVPSSVAIDSASSKMLRPKTQIASKLSELSMDGVAALECGEKRSSLLSSKSNSSSRSRDDIMEADQKRLSAVSSKSNSSFRSLDVTSEADQTRLSAVSSKSNSSFRSPDGASETDQTRLSAVSSKSNSSFRSRDGASEADQSTMNEANEPEQYRQMSSTCKATPVQKQQPVAEVMQPAQTAAASTVAKETFPIRTLPEKHVSTGTRQTAALHLASQSPVDENTPPNPTRIASPIIKSQDQSYPNALMNASKKTTITVYTISINPTALIHCS
jgi:hypothetical protein